MGLAPEDSRRIGENVDSRCERARRGRRGADVRGVWWSRLKAGMSSGGDARANVGTDARQRQRRDDEAVRISWV